MMYRFIGVMKLTFMAITIITLVQGVIGLAILLIMALIDISMFELVFIHLIRSVLLFCIGFSGALFLGVLHKNGKDCKFTKRV